MTRAARRRAWQWGHGAEALCIGTLMMRGYRILARRLRYPVGEIDIVARRGGTLAIIEVKARSHIGDAAEAVGGRQRRRITRAAEWLLAERPDLAQLTLRFDVMLVAPWRWPHHLRSAWRQEIR
jgi:putative endonuclease